MLYERYEPRDASEVVWSRQKATALRTIIDGMYRGTQPPRVIILHGPAGGGKLCSLKAILHTQFSSLPEASGCVHSSASTTTPTPSSSPCSSTFHPPSATLSESRIHVFHTCESPSIGSYHFLRLAQSRLEGLPFSTEILDRTDIKDGSPPHTSTGRIEQHSDGIHVFIVKFYGESSSDPVHRHTIAFLQQFEKLRDAALRQQSSDLSRLVARLRRTFIFFVHTAHDTHSGKMDLSSSFPYGVLHHPAVELFHCTAITPLNMKKRLIQILSREANLRGSGAVNHTSPAVSCSGVRRRRSSSSAAHRISPTLPISADHLDAIAEASQGDIRQALLQTQWIALHAIPSTQKGRCSYKPEALSEDEEINKLCYRILQRVERSAEDDRCAVVEVDAAPRSPAEEVVLLDEDDSISSDESVTVTSDQACSQLIAPTTSASAAFAARLPQAGKLSILDLMEITPTYGVAAATTSVIRSGRKRGRERSLSICPAEKRTVSRTSRDEYMDLAHATARLLTQRYTLVDVMKILNVPPRKLLGYLMNNMPAYFLPDQIDEYEHCAAAGSESDARQPTGLLAFGSQYQRNRLALRTSDDGEEDGILQQLVNVAALTIFDREYRVHLPTPSIPRTFLSQRPPPFQRNAYPRQRDVERQSRNGRCREYGVSPMAKDAEAITHLGWSELEWHQHFINRLEERERSTNPEKGSQRLPVISCEEVDILREGLPSLLQCCGSVDAAVLELWPYAQYIVMQRESRREMSTEDSGQELPPSAAVTSFPSSDYLKPSRAPGQRTTSPFSERSSQFFSQVNEKPMPSMGRAKRTIFTLSGAPTPPVPCGSENTKRPCSELRYRLLRRGMLPSAVIREAYFRLDEGASAVGADNFTGELPLLPDGDTIEEYSD